MVVRRTQRGKGFLDVFKKIGSTLGTVANQANNLLRSTKAISTLGSLVPHPGAQKVAGVAGALGYGRRRRVGRPRKQRGTGFLSSIFPPAALFGLGKTRRRRRRRV